jgi:hypothetical protein
VVKVLENAAQVGDVGQVAATIQSLGRRVFPAVGHQQRIAVRQIEAASID